MVRYEVGTWQLPSASRFEGEQVADDLEPALDSFLATCRQAARGIEHVDVIVCLFGPPVSQVQKLEEKDCTVEREILSR